MARTLINVSNRLPVTVGHERITKSSGGLVAALEGLSAQEFSLKWIGWPGGAVASEKLVETERTLIDEHGCIPVFLTEEEAAAHYEGFSNSSVWPLLHYMPNYLRYESGWWEAYRQVNERFAGKVLEIAREGDLVWVHDYQLLLLPALLKAARPDLRIGFFLHTSFPAYDVFRCHPRRRELVEGMLGADLLGFHTFSYLRHFREAASHLLAIESEITRVHLADGRRASLGVYPIGINAKKFDETLDGPDHAERRAKFCRTFEGKRIILSVERMDYTKGILHRLEAVDCYLADLENRDEVKFIFVSVPSREGVEDYQELRADVESRVGRLNGKYATLHNSPIHFIHGSVEFGDLCALYAIAEVALVTPLIDGMNLVAKEFLACQRENPAPLILSEFAGAAEELFAALLVNPYDASAVAATITQALAMSPEEIESRTRPMRDRVMRCDAQRWAKRFIDDLTAAGEQDQGDDASGADLQSAARTVSDALRAGGRVAVFLDYDGTLRELERDPAAARPSGPVVELLDLLAGKERLDVTVISGRTAADLESFLGDRPFGLIAEHGASFRPRDSVDWQAQDAGGDSDWKSLVLPILRLHEEATPGSAVEEKSTSLVWHYRRSDPEFGQWKADQLADTLSAVTANAPVLVRQGHKIVEIVSTGISKGGAVNRFLNDLPPDHKPAVILCAGDDATDESMFTLGLENVVTVKVGKGATQAQYRVDDPAAFRRFLTGAVKG